MNIVQIGTNRANDNLTSLVYKYNPDQIQNLILVEPFAIHNDKIRDCYTNYYNSLHIENIIISHTEDTVQKLCYHPDDLAGSNTGELASLNPDHSIGIRYYYNKEELLYLELPNLTIDQLFNKYNLHTIDILYIDTEGFDDKIIYSIDFNKFLIKTIYYEHLHIDRDKLRLYLKENNYNIDIETNSYPYCDCAIKSV